MCIRDRSCRAQTSKKTIVGVSFKREATMRNYGTTQEACLADPFAVNGADVDISLDLTELKSYVAAKLLSVKKTPLLHKGHKP